MIIPFPRNISKIEDYASRNHVSDPNCTVDCCDAGLSYPQRCICGGLIHCTEPEQGDSYYGTDAATYCDQCNLKGRSVSEMVSGIGSFLKETCIRELGVSFTVPIQHILTDHTDFCKSTLIRELNLSTESDWEAIHHALGTRNPMYEEYPSKYMLGKGDTGGMELCRRQDAQELGLPKDASWVDIFRARYLPKQLSLQVGTFFSKKLLVSALEEKLSPKRDYNDHIDKMLRNDFPIEKRERTIELVLVRVGLLVSDTDRDSGIKRLLSVVKERGLACGLELCPAETALQMLIQDKVNRGCWYKVMSEPILAEEKIRLSNGTDGHIIPSGQFNYRTFGVGVRDTGQRILFASDPEDPTYRYHSEMGDYDSEALVFMRSPNKKLSLPAWQG